MSQLPGAPRPDGLDDDSDIDFSEEIGSIGSLLANTINQLRDSAAQVDTALTGPPHTTTTTATGSASPYVVLGVLGAIAALWYFSSKA